MSIKKEKENEMRAFFRLFLLRFEQVVFLFAVVVLGALFYSSLHPDSGLGARRDEPKLIVFDVGQGDAILIDGGSGEQMLIDGGPDGTVLKKLGRFMPPDDRVIEYAVLTHAHADHIFGFLGVMERFEVLRFVYSDSRADSPVYDAFVDAARKEGAERIIPEAGREFAVGKIRVRILRGGEAGTGENNASVVLRAEYGEGSVLLMGDLEAEGEMKLVLEGIDEADALKVGHHGSKTSSTEEFLDAARPAYAMISVGAENGYGHPHPSAISRLKGRGIRILRTDLDGDIVLRFGGDGVILNPKH